MKINVGDIAPEFESTDQDGKKISLSEFKGHKVVLYFYPKDNTPGCTAEACNLRDNFDMFTSKGYVILGISSDTEKSRSPFDPLAIQIKLPAKSTSTASKLG